MKTFLIAVRAMLYMSGFLFVFGWIALRARTFDRVIPLQLPAYSPILGILVAVPGAILALLCAVVFVARGRGTPAIFDPPLKFVAVGPYKYVRNPMYIGGLGLLIGFGLYLRSLSILVLAVILFLVVHLLVLFYEEPILREKFDGAYKDYCRTVHRWIPRLPGRRE